MSTMQQFLKQSLTKTKDLILILSILTASTILFSYLLKNFTENNLILLISQQIILILPVSIYLTTKKTSLTELGFTKFSLTKTLTDISLAFLIFFSLNLVINLIQQKFNLTIPGYGQQQSYQPVFDGINFYMILFIASIIAPLTEETLFRGLIFSKIQTNQNQKILISAGLFSLIHFQFNVLIPLFLIGTILGKLRTTQNSIWPAIIFHSINNLLAVLVTFHLTS